MLEIPEDYLDQLACAAWRRAWTREFPSFGVPSEETWQAQSEEIKEFYSEIAARSQEYVFFREGNFYPIILLDDEDAIKNAEWNPGTIRVEDLDGRVVWTERPVQ